MSININQELQRLERRKQAILKKFKDNDERVKRLRLQLDEAEQPLRNELDGVEAKLKKIYKLQKELGLRDD